MRGLVIWLIIYFLMIALLQSVFHPETLIEWILVAIPSWAVAEVCQGAVED